jgi:hypothetical protein
MMHECYQLGIIDHDTVSSFVRFCLQFWMGHYRMKKQQFDMAQQDIEQKEKKKLAATSLRRGRHGRKMGQFNPASDAEDRKRA